jgi:hypothetical protein
VIVEVKTGNSKLNANEIQVRNAIQAGKVEYQVIRLPLPENRELPKLPIEVAASTAGSLPRLEVDRTRS